MGDTRKPESYHLIHLQPHPIYMSLSLSLCVCVYRGLSTQHVVSNFVPEWENVWNVFFFFGGVKYIGGKAYRIMHHPTTGVYTLSHSDCVYTHAVLPIYIAFPFVYTHREPSLLNPPPSVPSYFMHRIYILKNAFHSDPYWSPRFPTHTQTTKSKRKEMSFSRRKTTRQS